MMFTVTKEAPGAASSPYVPVAPHELRRQASMPAAFAPRGRGSRGVGGGGGHDAWPGNLGDDGADADLRGRALRRPGVAAAVRALWAWVARGGGRRVGRSRSRSRSGSSSSAKEQRYGHEEYAQNFDEGAAAGEPENLARSFSARYARRAPWDGAR